MRKPNSPATQAAIELVSKAKSESEQSERNLAAQSALNMAESLKDAKKTGLKRATQVKKNASGMKGYTGYAIRTDEEARAAEEEAHGPRNWRTAEEFADLRYNQQELPLAARQRAAADESRRNRLSRAEAGAWRGRTQAKVGNLIDLTDEEDDSRRPSRSQSTKDLPVIQETAAEVMASAMKLLVSPDTLAREVLGVASAEHEQRQQIAGLSAEQEQISDANTAKKGVSVSSDLGAKQVAKTAVEESESGDEVL